MGKNIIHIVVLFMTIYNHSTLAQKKNNISFYDLCEKRWHLNNVTAYRVQCFPYTKDSLAVCTIINNNYYWFPIRFLDSLLRCKKYITDNGMEKLRKSFSVACNKYQQAIHR